MQRLLTPKRNCSPKVTQDLYDNLGVGKQTYVVLLEYAKALDKVPHRKLVQKLMEYGITGTINKRIESLLKERQLRVLCEIDR